MKKLMILVIVAALFNKAGFSQPNDRFKNMVGSWEIISNQDPGGKLDVIDSNTIVIKYMGDEKKLTGCKIDFSKSPFWFDFSAKDTSSAASSFKSIFEFINDDTMRWEIFEDGNRQDHFTSDKGELLYLRRAVAKPTVVAAN